MKKAVKKFRVVVPRRRTDETEYDWLNRRLTALEHQLSRIEKTKDGLSAEVRREFLEQLEQIEGAEIRLQASLFVLNNDPVLAEAQTDALDRVFDVRKLGRNQESKIKAAKNRLSVYSSHRKACDPKKHAEYVYKKLPKPYREKHSQTYFESQIAKAHSLAEVFPTSTRPDLQRMQVCLSTALKSLYALPPMAEKREPYILKQSIVLTALKTVIHLPVEPSDDYEEKIVRLIKFWMNLDDKYPVIESHVRHSNERLRELIESGRTCPIEVLSDENVDWELLPAGDFDTEQFVVRVRGIAKFHGWLNEYDPSRLRDIEKLRPYKRFIGRAGFEGYVAYLFWRTPKVVLECPRKGNATYVFRNNWETISRLTKSEVITHHGDVVQRIFHTKNWLENLRNALDPLS